MSMIEERQWNTVDLDETRISKKSSESEIFSTNPLWRILGGIDDFSSTFFLSISLKTLKVSRRPDGFRAWQNNRSLRYSDKFIFIAIFIAQTFFQRTFFFFFFFLRARAFNMIHRANVITIYLEQPATIHVQPSVSIAMHSAFVLSLAKWNKEARCTTSR